MCVETFNLTANDTRCQQKQPNQILKCLFKAGQPPKKKDKERYGFNEQNSKHSTLHESRPMSYVDNKSLV